MPGWQWRPVQQWASNAERSDPQPSSQSPPPLTLCPNMPLATAFNPSVSLDVIERVDGCRDWDACQYVRSSVLLPVHVCVKCSGSCLHTFCSDTPLRCLCCHSCSEFNFLGLKLLQATPHARAEHTSMKTFLYIEKAAIFKSFRKNNHGFTKNKSQDLPFPDLEISEGLSGGVGMQRPWVCKSAMSMSFQWEGHKKHFGHKSRSGTENVKGWGGGLDTVVSHKE